MEECVTGSGTVTAKDGIKWRENKKISQYLNTEMQSE
jgi:hypothetical protein